MTPAEQLIREGAQVTTRADVYRWGVLEDHRRVLDGSVTVDASANIMRECGITLHGTIPQTPTDPLAPSGTTLKLFRGVKDWTGEEFTWSQGVFGFEETAGSRKAPSEIPVTGFDFSRYVAEARWEEPYEIPRGTPVATAIEAALASRLPESLMQPLNAVSVPSTTPYIVWGEERDNDPWDDLQKLAAASGLWLYFDRDGAPTLEQQPDPDQIDASWTYIAGDEQHGRMYLDGTKTWVGRPYNVFVIRGEPGDDDQAPILATVVDDDPTSPSYVGNYRRPYFLTSSYITTIEQAEGAGQAELNRRKGLGELVSIRSVPLPLLDVGMAVRATDPVIGVDARYVIDRMTMPMRLGEMQLETRRRRL